MCNYEDHILVPSLLLLNSALPLCHTFDCDSHQGHSILPQTQTLSTGAGAQHKNKQVVPSVVPKPKSDH